MYCESSIRDYLDPHNVGEIFKFILALIIKHAYFLEIIVMKVCWLVVDPMLLSKKQAKYMSLRQDRRNTKLQPLKY